MSDENSAISVTLKAGKDFDSPWVVVRGDDPATVNQRLDALGQLGVLATAAKVAIELQGAYAAGKGLGATPTQVQGSEQQATWSAPQEQAAPQQSQWQQGPTTPASPSPAPPAQAAQGPSPLCNHGPRKWVTGQSAKGQWQAWMCPTPKGAQDKCDPLWARPDGSPKQ